MATSDDSLHCDPEDLRSAFCFQGQSAYFEPEITLSEDDDEAWKDLREYRDRLLVLRTEAMRSPLHPDFSFEAVVPRHPLADDPNLRRSLPAGLRDLEIEQSRNFRFTLSHAIQPYIPVSLRKPDGLLQWSQVWKAHLQDVTTGTTLSSVIVKIIQSSLLPLPNMNEYDPAMEYTFGRQVAMAEHYAYAYPLRDIQGMAVPYCFGREMVTMPSGEQARVLILEEIPGVTMKSWCETFEKASLEEKAVLRESLVRIIRGIIKSYTLLFDKGVIHNDVCLENMIVTPQNQVIILDFANIRFNMKKKRLTSQGEIRQAASMVLVACRNADRAGFVEWASGVGNEIIKKLKWEKAAKE